MMDYLLDGEKSISLADDRSKNIDAVVSLLLSSSRQSPKLQVTR
jgi:hypothetical protein